MFREIIVYQKITKSFCPPLGGGGAVIGQYFPLWWEVRFSPSAEGEIPNNLSEQSI